MKCKAKDLKELGKRLPTSFAIEFGKQKSLPIGRLYIIAFLWFKNDNLCLGRHEIRHQEPHLNYPKFGQHRLKLQIRIRCG